MNIYESDRLLADYLLFHYGSPDEILPWQNGPHDALDYPLRTVAENLNLEALPANARALDLGCAVGRSSFELARHCTEVVGIDFSQAFIATAQQLQQQGSLDYAFLEEGDLLCPATAMVSSEINRSRVEFQTGDAMALEECLGTFDVVHMANLIDRLSTPMRCLERLPSLIRPGGQLILTSPFTWLDEFTPRENWLGGFEGNGNRQLTIDSLQAVLNRDFTHIRSHNMPFLIREHARKFQWSMAYAGVWQRKNSQS